MILRSLLLSQFSCNMRKLYIKTLSKNRLFDTNATLPRPRAICDGAS
jgi:hypothetical protein